MKLIYFVFSTKTALILLSILTISMVAATFIEADQSHDLARSLVYETWWFELLFFWLSINFLLHLMQYQLWNKYSWPIGLFHLALIVIVFGGFMERYFNHSPNVESYSIGIWTMYVGCLLLSVGMFLSFFSRNGRFLYVLKSLKPIATHLKSLFSSVLLTMMVSFAILYQWTLPQWQFAMQETKMLGVVSEISVLGGYLFLVMSAVYGFQGLFQLIIASFQKTEEPFWVVKQKVFINEMVLMIGLFLLTVGTFGQALVRVENQMPFWSWDIPQTWALICIVLYSIVVHLRLIPALRNTLLFHFVSLWCFPALMMTLFGATHLHLLSSISEEEVLGVSIWITVVLFGFMAVSMGAIWQYNKIDPKNKLLMD